MKRLLYFSFWGKLEIVLFFFFFIGNQSYRFMVRELNIKGINGIIETVRE